MSKNDDHGGAINGWRAAMRAVLSNPSTEAFHKDARGPTDQSHESAIVLSFDLGLESLKCNLVGFDGESVEILAESERGYDLHVLGNGLVEQDTEAWWSAICEAARAVMSQTGISSGSIAGISLSAQMMGVILVDRCGVPVRPSINRLDSRGGEERRELLNKGLKFAGCNIIKLAKGFWGTGVMPLQDNDAVWKYKWVEKNEPEAFSRVYRWMDVKDYINGRMSGNFVATHDSAFVTMLYDPRRRGFNEKVCKMFKVNIDHLPDLIESTDRVGPLTEAAAKEMGLVPGIPVFGGGGDVNCAAIGSGAADVGEGHFHYGTFGWTSVTLDYTITDLTHNVCSAVGADKDRYNYLARMEIAGECLERVLKDIAVDDKGANGTDTSVCSSSGGVMDRIVGALADTKPGANGVIFTPWANGEGCTNDDTHISSMFFNTRVDTTKKDLMRAICEGICYDFRWMMESQSTKIEIPVNIRFIGWGAKNSAMCQMLSDITGMVIEVPEHPCNSGTLGAAMIAFVGLGRIPALNHAGRYVKATERYHPQEHVPEAYDRAYDVYRALYDNAKRSSHKHKKV